MAGLSGDIDEFIATSHEPKTGAESVASEKHSDVLKTHDDGLEPFTEHELATLRRVPDFIPLNTYRKSTDHACSIVLNPCCSHRLRRACRAFFLLWLQRRLCKSLAVPPAVRIIIIIFPRPILFSILYHLGHALVLEDVTANLAHSGCSSVPRLV
jgi:hypothetical protein